MVDFVSKIVDEFAISDVYVEELVHNFKSDALNGLVKDTERGIPMIPSFVTKIPQGSEKGLYLAADLGGSNFRVCSVRLNGNQTHEVKQLKWKVPNEIQRGKSSDFWSYLADRVQEFITKMHPEAQKSSDGALSLGFCFSFPVKQTGINRGSLLRWTKGFSVEGAIGQDICIEFQKALDERKLPVHVAALVNDTVGCLLARSYETGSKSQTMMGIILGTGTNAAYSEKVRKLQKLADYQHSKVDSKIMVINTEWGSFDNDLKFLPNTEIDQAIDADTPNPTFHMFEKRVSGMFLGEITRRVLERCVKRGELFQACQGTLPDNANIYQPWTVDTSFLSLIVADSSSEGSVVRQELEKIGVWDPTREEMDAVQKICHAVALRSARLVAGITAGLLDLTRAFEKFEIVDMGIDGSLYEFYPHYEDLIREAWRAIPTVGEREKRITIGISKDGSGIGAALCAAMADH